MKKLFLLMIAVIILSAVTVIVLSACNFKVDELNSNKYIPEDATFLEDWGNGWIVFESHGKKFLYRNSRHKGFWLDYAYEAITELKE